MRKLFTLSTLLLITFAPQANNVRRISPSPLLLNISGICSPLSVNNLFWNSTGPASRDSTPAPKEGLLKKLVQALQFRKNAKAREQARVLDIIARSGLKDSLQATVKVMDSANKIYRDTARILQASHIRELLLAIDSLKMSLKDSIARWKADASTASDLAGPASTQVDLPIDDQDIQGLVNQITSPIDAAGQSHLAFIRLLIQGSYPCADTVRISDSVSKITSYSIHKNADITAFYPYPDGQMGNIPDLRLIDELAWYAEGFKGSTGELTGLCNWATSAAIDSARSRGCRISLTLMSRDQKNIVALLKSTTARQKLIAGAIAALKLRNANGVIIQFDNLPGSCRDSFTSFITLLSEELKASAVHYRLSIRVPANDKEDAYALQKLNIHTDRFFLDFTQNTTPGPLAPLSGVQNDDLKSCLSRYVNGMIPSSKFVVCLPYYGVLWNIRPGHNNYTGSPGYITYSDIRDNRLFHQKPVYDPLGASERIDIKNKSGTLVGTLWYDDERTLAAKYDFILPMKLGGIAIQSLGYDEGYGDLWNVLASRFAQVDTTVTEWRKERHKTPALDDWQWSWTYISAKLEQYDFLFSYPCETKFPKILVKKWTAAGVKNNSRKSIWEEAATVMGTLAIAFAALCLTGVLLFIWKMRKAGDRWKWKKPLAGLLIFLFILLIINVFMYLFLDKSIIWFGVSNKPQDCFDFPLGVLFILIFTGLVFGILITRAFVFPLIKRDDIP